MLKHKHKDSRENKSNCFPRDLTLTFDVVVIIVIKHNHALLNNLLVHMLGTEKAHFITR